MSTYMSVKEQKEFIDSCYERLRRSLCESHPDGRDYFSRLQELHKADEREHRKFCSPRPSSDYSFSVSVSAKYFALTWVLRFLFDRDLSSPTLGDCLKVQPSVFYSAAIAVEFQEAIKKAFTKEDYETVSLIDYTK
jgi:hypothetical protein